MEAWPKRAARRERRWSAPAKLESILRQPGFKLSSDDHVVHEVGARFDRNNILHIQRFLTGRRMKQWQAARSSPRPSAVWVDQALAEAENISSGGALGAALASRLLKVAGVLALQAQLCRHLGCSVPTLGEAAGPLKPFFNPEQQARCQKLLSAANEATHWAVEEVVEDGAHPPQSNTLQVTRIGPSNNERAKAGPRNSNVQDSGAGDMAHTPRGPAQPGEPPPAPGTPARTKPACAPGWPDPPTPPPLRRRKGKGKGCQKDQDTPKEGTDATGGRCRDDDSDGDAFSDSATSTSTTSTSSSAGREAPCLPSEPTHAAAESSPRNAESFGPCLST